jgi:drug/metabolite transporter (DMT)-like permease
VNRIAAHKRGNIAMVLAMGMFVLNDALVKLVSETYPASQIMAVRGLFACMVTFALVIVLGQRSSLGRVFSLRVMCRAMLEGLVAFVFITALAKLPLANITAILLASSLLIIVLAVVLGIDRIGWRRGLAVLVGFAGVLLVVQPQAEGFNIYSLLALLSAILVAGRDLLTRKIAADVPSGIVAFATTAATALVGALLGLTQGWQPLEWHGTGLMVAAAIAVALGNTGIIIAFRDGDIAVVSGLRYSVLLFALLAGFLVWGEWPNGLAIIGSALIVVSGLYAMHRQSLRQREALAYATAHNAALPESGPTSAKASS